MPTKLRGSALSACALVAAGCDGQHITTDYSPVADFGQFRTYALVSRPDGGPHPLVEERVAEAVRAQLAAKGLTPADRAECRRHQ
jgi:hypothetical protein